MESTTGDPAHRLTLDELALEAGTEPGYVLQVVESGLLEPLDGSFDWVDIYRVRMIQALEETAKYVIDRDQFARFRLARCARCNYSSLQARSARHVVTSSAAPFELIATEAPNLSPPVPSAAVSLVIRPQLSEPPW